MTLFLASYNTLDTLLKNSSEPLIDSDRESNKSDDSDVLKEQQMCMWNPKFEVCVKCYDWVEC